MNSKTIEFTINGTLYHADSAQIPLDTSLNSFIRDHAHLKGTKFMCNEGGCGACIVTVRRTDPYTRQVVTGAANSCLLPLFSCHGCDVITVEHLGNQRDGYHAIQSRLAYMNGTQCGYCSPGFVMNMFGLLEANGGKVTMKEIENSFGGNMCRCTGYRPILDAFKSFASDAPKQLLDTCRDIEDLHKICPKSGSPCAGKCAEGPKKALHLSAPDGRDWYKAYSLKDVQEALKRRGDRSYILVAGNTAHGVYRRSKKIAVYIDVSEVAELRAFSIGKQIELGGGVSLTQAMKVLEKAANTNPEFSYCSDVVRHIDLIANVPVRNFGTLAGNLSIKHEHPEFPSDIFILLETIGAKIVLSDHKDFSMTTTPLEFLGIKMSGRIITKIILPPLDPKIYRFRSYKIMIRAQNAHAYVNAGFLLRFDSSITEARLCFGGIKPGFTHASSTEEFLKGNRLNNNRTLQLALEELSQELEPDHVLPDASPKYRKNLALALFYKFVLDTFPEDKLDKRLLSGAKILERPVSSGRQEFDSNKENWPLNQYVPKVEGFAQCAGEAEYVNDMMNRPDDLYAAFVIGTKSRAKILEIDPKPALALPGVQAFYSAKDIPGRNSFVHPTVFYGGEEDIFASDRVLHYGHPVGMIVAKTASLANEAALLVNIKYEASNEPLYPTVKDVFKANAKDRIVQLPFNINATESGPNPTHKVTGRFEIGGQYHYTMETQVCYTIPSDEGMDVYSATQFIDSVQVSIAQMLKLPQNVVNVRVKRLGGGYGAKISRPALVACACALASYKLQRPVRFVMTLEANMLTIGKRCGVVSDYEVEVDDEGRIQRLKNDYCEDNGCLSPECLVFVTNMFISNCYDTKFWSYAGTMALTDSASNTWCRAPGSTEAIAMTETIMEHIAWTLKKEPLDVRMANIPEGSQMRGFLTDFLESVDYKERKQAIETFNGENRWRKRGIAFVPMEYPQHYYGSFHATVSIFGTDGSVGVIHGGIEMGQGLNTKVAQTVAYGLGVSLDKVKIKASTSLNAPNNAISGGSVASELVSFAAKKCSEILLERLKPIKENPENAGKSWTELCQAAMAANVDLMASYMYKPGDVNTYTIWGASCAEVEVDLLTGNLQINRVDILEDTGESLSPGVDIGQIEGAFIMGVGYWLTEELNYDPKTGALLNNRTWTYKPPGAKDIPIDFRIKLLQKSSNPHGVLRSKATGEPATLMSIVVLFALRNALNSARKDVGLDKEWLALESPTTPESIFLSAGSTIENFKI